MPLLEMALAVEEAYTQLRKLFKSSRPQRSSRRRKLNRRRKSLKRWRCSRNVYPVKRHRNRGGEDRNLSSRSSSISLPSKWTSQLQAYTNDCTRAISKHSLRGHPNLGMKITSMVTILSPSPVDVTFLSKSDLKAATGFISKRFSKKQPQDRRVELQKRSVLENISTAIYMNMSRFFRRMVPANSSAVVVLTSAGSQAEAIIYRIQDFLNHINKISEETDAAIARVNCKYVEAAETQFLLDLHEISQRLNNIAVDYILSNERDADATKKTPTSIKEVKVSPLRLKLSKPTKASK